MNFVPQNADDLMLEVTRYRTTKLSFKKGWGTKVKAIEEYLKKWGIKDVVVGVSGGVDSALVLALLAKIPDITIHAVTIQFINYRSVFNSEYIFELQEQHSDKENIKWYDRNLSWSQQEMMREMGLSTSHDNVNANVTYAMRYLAFFALAQQVGGIVFGTTNRDELEYAGWFGKHSDMNVDVQPIADLHKFEVWRMAEELNVPESIITRSPVGDLIDRTSDEENFGCTYDELSWFGYAVKYIPGLADSPFIKQHFSKLINLHRKNGHKYQRQGWNAVFL